MKPWPLVGHSSGRTSHWLFGVQALPGAQAPQVLPQPSSPHCLPPQLGVQPDPLLELAADEGEPTT